MREDGGTTPALRTLASRAVLLGLLLLVGCQSKPPFEGKSVTDLEGMLRSSNPTVQVEGAYGLGRLGPGVRGPDL